jgi:uncharacterized protein (TIGR02231 family)
MKRIIFIALLFVSAFSYAEENEKKITSSINNVTVFIQGAQVHRSGYASVPKGNSTLVFDNLANSINVQSIQATGRGAFTILDVQYRYHYPKPVVLDNSLPDAIQKELNQLMDTATKINFQLINIREKRAAIEKEKQLILNHPLVQGRTKSDSLGLLIGTVDYIQDQLASIADRKLAVQMAENELTKKQQQVNQKIQDLRNYNSNKPKPKPNQPSHQILVHVYAASATKGKVSLSYNVNNAGWSPTYDIKATSFTKPIELTYKASVYQNTGIDWKNVKLTFSNSNPNLRSTKPVLPVWYVDYYVHQKRNVTALSNATSVARRNRYFKEIESVEEDEVLDDLEVAKATTQYTNKVTNFSSVEFKVDVPFHIPSNGQRKTVLLENHELEGSYKHYIVPKLDRSAFVMAQVTGWEKLDLLVGGANVYFGGTLVGKTVLDPTAVQDTLLLSLGRDRNINVMRKLKDSETKTPLIGSNKTYTATYYIEVKNRNSTPVELVVEDHIPNSRNENIEVELEKKADGKLETDTGFITWEFKLNPYAIKKWEYRFTITYPKDKTIALN